MRTTTASFYHIALLIFVAMTGTFGLSAAAVSETPNEPNEVTKETVQNTNSILDSKRFRQRLESCMNQKGLPMPATDANATKVKSKLRSELQDCQKQVLANIEESEKTVDMTYETPKSR